LTAAVTGANEVTVMVWNNTGGAIDLDSAVFKVVVGRPNF
jgi:N-acetyl-beta-hexosaminidase